MRFLFVSWDGGGNLHCVLPLAQRLIKKGHEVKFLAGRPQQKLIEAHGCSFASYRKAPENIASSAEEALIKDWKPRFPLASAGLYRDRIMVGPAKLFASDVLDQICEDDPDAIAIDFFLFGALAAAERSGLPAAVIWHTVYAPPSVDVPVFGMGRGLPRGRVDRLAQKIARRMSKSWWDKSLPALNAARVSLDLAPLSGLFAQFDRLDRVLVTSSAAFDFAALRKASIPPNVRYIGPQVNLENSDRTQTPSQDDIPLVLVSFSTTYQDQQELLQRTADALGELPVRALLTTGPAVRLREDQPANVEVKQWVDHSDVLPYTSLVITHAGHGTVMNALAHGVPVICLPMGRDQGCVAARVTHSGAGLRLSRNPSKRQIAESVRRALGDSNIRASAKELQNAFCAEITTDLGVAEMEALARSKDTSEG